MTNRTMYEKRKKTLLHDPTVCIENRQLFKEFFEYEEYKLKRVNGLNALDEPTYKTLLEYCSRFRTVNKWFDNKPWKGLTKQDIQRVYDNLEDGKIKSIRGSPFKNKATYYNKIFKSKPFELAGKSSIAKEVLRAFKRSQHHDEDVRYIEVEDFTKLIGVIANPIHKLLFWLAWDLGENITSLLHLTKSEFCRQINEETREPEYRVHLPKDILKRSRRTRSELTNYPETVSCADIILKSLGDKEPLFLFEYRQAKKVFDRAVRLTGIKCKPGNQRPTWKDLRSGMACHLLKSGWHTDEINARLGHAPSSKELDKYVNFLAINRHQPKKKLYDGSLAKVQIELEEAKQREKLFGVRIDGQKSVIDDLNDRLSEMETHLRVRKETDALMNQLFKDARGRKLLAELTKKTNMGTG